MLVSTPIGNLKDFSARGCEALMAVDFVLCEDTRTSAVLLKAHGIKARLVAFHEHNEDAAIPGILVAMREGKRYALISDAGTPLVSDPGFRLVRAVIAAGFLVGGVPGANAAVLAVTLSGLPPQPFYFAGFLAAKAGPRQAEMARLAQAEAAGFSATMVFYEAPHRLAAFLGDAAAAFGDRPAAVCRELTKHFEEVRRGGLAALAVHYGREAARGEITVVIGPGRQEAVSGEDVDAALVRAMGTMSLKDAVEAVTAATGLPRRQVYARALEVGKKE
jgi:16S rRNA (cytidine1402-2'-O)-methyltransferase